MYCIINNNFLILQCKALSLIIRLFFKVREMDMLKLNIDSTTKWQNKCLQVSKLKVKLTV